MTGTLWISLLNALAGYTNCNHLSDLQKPMIFRKLCLAVKDISAMDFTQAEWENAYAFISGKVIQGERERIRDSLILFLDQNTIHPKDK